MPEPQGFKEKEFSSHFDAGLWKRLFKYAKPLYPIVGILVICMIFLALLDGVYPLFTRYAIDSLVPFLGTEESNKNILFFIAIYAGITLIQGCVIFFFIMMAGIIEVRLCHILREKAFSQLQELSFSYYDKTPAGWIMSRMTSDAQKLGDTIAWGLVDFVWGSAIMISIISFMLAMNWKLALVTLSFTPILLFVTFWFQKKILKTQRKVRKSNSLLSGIFNEGLQGARTSKTLVLEESNTEEFAAQSSILKRHSLVAARLSALYMPIVVFLAATGAALALGKGGSMVVQGVLSYGTLVAFVNYTMMFFDPAREVARVLSEFQAAQASAERLLSLIETKPEIVDKIDAKNTGEIQGDLSLSNVSFHYGNGQWIFKDFSLQIPKGQTLAVVGETGSGKSTLVNLLCRFYEPTAGSILIDGEDYRERTRYWLHSRLGYVLQTPLLFSGSILENIRYGRLEATDDEVFTAAHDANASGFIEKLEKKYETMVGEGGVLLSTGQKQLISLARALVANPSLMILDEATSSIDTETEVLIQGAIERLLKGRTSIVIAHRLSTIRNADRIIVLNKGIIIEDGTHEELMALRRLYWSLYTRQFLEEAVGV
ncbi:MAG TPA: ABC transporter ATP-binding protein [Treponemataceae bacterium]|nr:ABC transporter ATP-binding protein [Treponemataceae bacterium]